jgi:hypothetical protein
VSRKREILGLLVRAELAEAVERFELEPDDRRKKDALVEASSGSSTSSG